MMYTFAGIIRSHVLALDEGLLYLRNFNPITLWINALSEKTKFNSI